MQVLLGGSKRGCFVVAAELWASCEAVGNADMVARLPFLRCEGDAWQFFNGGSTMQKRLVRHTQVAAEIGQYGL